MNDAAGAIYNAVDADNFGSTYAATQASAWAYAQRGRAASAVRRVPGDRRAGRRQLHGGWDKITVLGTLARTRPTARACGHHHTPGRVHGRRQRRLPQQWRVARQRELRGGGGSPAMAEFDGWCPGEHRLGAGGKQAKSAGTTMWQLGDAVAILALGEVRGWWIQVSP